MIRSWLQARKQAQVEKWARETRAIDWFNSESFDKEIAPAVIEWLLNGGEWPVKPPAPALRGRRR